MLGNNDLIKILGMQPIMKGLTESELMEIYSYIEILFFPSGATVFAENDRSNDLYIIIEGEVSLVKNEGQGLSKFPIANLSKNDVFGEFSFLDNSPRSCNVIATTDLHLIKMAKSLSEGSIAAKYIYGKITQNLSNTLIHRLRETNQKMMSKRKTENKNKEFNKIIVNLVLRSAVFLFIILGLINYFHSSQLITHHLIVINWVGLIGFLMTYYKEIKLYPYLTAKLDNNESIGHKSFWRSFVWCGVAIAFMGLVFLGLQLFGITDPQHLQAIPISQLFSYPLYVLLLEFVLRSIFQTSLTKLLSQPKWAGVVYTAIIIAVGNLPFGMTTTALVFALNLCCGFLYFEYRNLLTTVLLHLFIVWMLQAHGYLLLANFS